MGIVIREVQASGDSKSDSELLENVVSGMAATAVSLCLSWSSLNLAVYRIICASRCRALISSQIFFALHEGRSYIIL